MRLSDTTVPRFNSPAEPGLILGFCQGRSQRGRERSAQSSSLLGMKSSRLLGVNLRAPMGGQVVAAGVSRVQCRVAVATPWVKMTIRLCVCLTRQFCVLIRRQNRQHRGGGQHGRGSEGRCFFLFFFSFFFGSSLLFLGVAGVAWFSCTWAWLIGWNN